MSALLISSLITLALVSGAAMIVAHFSNVVVGEDERIVIFRRGVPHRTKSKGRVFFILGLETWTRVSLRPQAATLEFPSLRAVNGAWMAAILEVEFVVLQPEQAATLMRQTRLSAAIEQLISIAFDAAVGSLPPESLISQEDRRQLGRSLKKAVNETALSWGLNLMAIEVEEVREIAGATSRDNVTWEVVLLAPGDNPISTMRALTQATDLALLEAKELLSNLPATLPAAGDVERAENLRQQLEASGAVVAVRRVRESVDSGNVGSETVDIVLEAPGLQVLDVISVLRRITGWDLAHTKAVVEQTPYAIMRRVRAQDAQEVKRSLETVGATVELV
ncbi:MAG: ribosomal protein L7/L12 [Candidatus Sericytochromatia bacterium]|nr:ribosomal protein L7/L12 [Candidatus Sericytochromatia bacterium]